MTTSPKIALVTGGSRGLGRNTAVSLARKGTDVILTYQSRRGEAEAAVDEIQGLGRRAVALRLDAGDTASFAAFAGEVRAALRDTWGRDTFDHLVSNAGFGHNAPFADTTEAAFDGLVAVHLKGPYFLTQALLPLLADGGRIVNLSSGLARFTLPGMSAYAMMKGGVEVMTRYLAKELGGRGIAVRDNPAYNRSVAQATALGRAGLPDDIGPMIAALLTEDNRWINGQRIEVAGGVYL